ncbi:MAG: DNA polymerase III subunit gamma/tau [Gammaproteobacteria bacterium]|nr:DNA polymerase III subunit gamma/tau [Gammaproteobacteria bacterium]
MSYQVLARKWRPANFKQMVGQEHVLQALINALDSNRLHHAYLFSGTRGVGKTTIARIFAKSLNCEQGISSEPCGSCSSCIEIDEGRSVDLIEIDAASRTGVDDMRELLDNVQYAPTRGRYKIYLIDEVHMLSRHSFNALLKTLEEPPPHIKFLLATTDPQKVPVTVLSRCLQFNLKRMSKAQILSQLQYLAEQEKIEADATALTLLASAADGSMRDALSLLDQAIGYGAGVVQQDAVESMLGSISRDNLIRLFDALVDQQATTLLREARVVIEHNPDYQRICAEMITLLQHCALYQNDPGLLNEDEFGEQLLQKYSSHWSAEEIQLFYQILLQGRQDLLICPDEATGFEMLMLRLLAFSPMPEASVLNVEVKKKPESGHVVNQSTVDQASPDSDRITDLPARPVLEPATDLLLDPPQVKPVADQADIPLEQEVDEHALLESSTQTDRTLSVATAADADLDWSALAYELELAGLAQEIVANSWLLSWQDGKLKLELQAEIYELLNDLIKTEILQALEQKLGVSLQLDLVATQSLTGQTPLQAKIERLHEERLAAIDAIRHDQMVKKLQQVFAAELDEASVIKIQNHS